MKKGHIVNKRTYAGKLVHDLQRMVDIVKGQVATTENVAMVTNLVNTINGLKVIYKIGAER